MSYLVVLFMEMIMTGLITFLTMYYSYFVFYVILRLVLCVASLHCLLIFYPVFSYFVYFYDYGRFDY